MSDTETNQQTPASTTFHDPVCGMTVDPAQARGRAQHQGETYYFCSPGCMHKFVSDPGKYLVVLLQARRHVDRSHRPDRRHLQDRSRPGLRHERRSREGRSQRRARSQALSLLLQRLRRKVQGRSAKISLAELQARRHGIEHGTHDRRSDAGHCATATGASCRTGEANGRGCKHRLGLPHVSRGAREQARALSQVRHGAGARNARRVCHPHRVDLPDASRDRARPARILSYLRHGARAANRHRCRTGQSRAARHDASLLGKRHSRRAARRARHVANDVAHGAACARGLAARGHVDRIPAGDADRALGGMAVLSARLGLGKAPQPQHVHADRARRRRRLHLQRGRNAASANFS